ncbi:hypothetical protein [Actinoplanes palleronii]|uniref:hypothetical protein n=1 Tax=Actinoplanes palleronii TaxID=113570 RepID=UPI001943B3FE|nr:hypothetical protein [Actinoplanes palleronii]
MDGKDDRESPPALRIARYLDDPAPRPQPVRNPPGMMLPNIADYWPDAPHRVEAAAKAAGWRAFLPASPDFSGTAEAPSSRRPHRPVILTGVLALLVIGGTVVLARPLTDADIRQRAITPVPALPSESPAVVGPAPTTTAPSPAATTVAPRPPLPTSAITTTTPPARIRTARFELVSGITDFVVRTATLDDVDFRVRGGEPTFTDGVLRVTPAGGGSPVEVQLSDRIVWGLRMAGGVKTATFDLTGATISRIDLDGGAETIDITLGRLTRTLPIRMAGGVSQWHIRTDREVPVLVEVGDGAGDIAIYGRHEGGTAPGAVIRSGDLGDAAGLDVDAAAGMGLLEIS